MSEAFPKDVLLRVGGAVLARHGIAAVAGSRRGSVEVPITMARADASTCATTIDRDGIVRLAAANVLRVQWEDLDGDGIRETPGLLLEGSRTNSCLQSEAFGTTWTLFDVTVSSNLDTAPDGAVTADRLVEDASASQEHVAYQTLAGTSNTKHSFSVFAKAGTRTWLVLTIRDVAGMTNSVSAFFNLATGAVGTVTHSGAGSGEQAFIEKLANGWYRCKLIGACNNADTTPLTTVGIANADNGRIYNGDGASYISVWGGQFEQDQAFPSSYIKTTTVAVTRAADSLTLPFNFGPMDLTVLARIARPVHADAAGVFGVHLGVFQLGTSAGGGISGLFNSFDRSVISKTYPGANQSVRSVPAGASISAAWQFKNLTTAPQSALDVGAGFSTFHTANTPFATFGNQTLRSGFALEGGSDGLYGVLLDLKVFRGLFTLAEALAVP